MTFTRYVGEVGVEGTRIVRPSGVILFNTLKLQHERLLPFVGKEVFCRDTDPDIYIHVAEYPTYRTTDKNPKAYAGEWIITISSNSENYSYRPVPTKHGDGAGDFLKG